MKQQNLKKIIALTASSLVLGVGMANADLIIDDNGGAKATEVKKETKKVKKVAKTKTHHKASTTNLKEMVSYFKTTGKRVEYQKFEGFAQDITLREAIEQLVPSDWKIEVNEKVDLSQKVNFVGGKTWDKVLEDLSKNTFSGNLNWDDKKLEIYPVSFSERKIVKNASFAENDKASLKKQKSMKSSAKYSKSDMKSKKVVKREKSWFLNKNMTLKENVEAWGKKAGWTVVWKAPDYKVLASTTLKGEIDSEKGPIVSLLKLYEDSTFPLRVNILGGNKVIHVENKGYTPKSVIDLSKDIE